MNFYKKCLKYSLDMGSISSAYSTVLHAAKLRNANFFIPNNAVLTYPKAAFFIKNNIH